MSFIEDRYMNMDRSYFMDTLAYSDDYVITQYNI